MNLLVQWIIQIIIFLMIATIIDLLIPQTAMKKYINLVIGLILILLFLKPLFFLFQINIDKELNTMLSTLDENNQMMTNNENLLKQQKSEIQASHDAYILEEVKIQLVSLVENELLDNFQASITDIEFEFIEDLWTTQFSYENLEEVTVFLAKTTEKETGNEDRLEPIHIQTDQPPRNELEKDDVNIERLLRQVWELHDKRIILQWEGGTS